MRTPCRFLYQWLAILVALPFLLSSCGSSYSAPQNPTTYTIGGTLTNLAAASGGVVLQDNGGDNLTLTANGAFTFHTAVATSGAYAVTVLTQPSSPAQTCSVANGTGTANANVSNIAVDCSHNEWTWVSGSKIPNQNGAYGTINVPAAANVPGVRNFGPSSWTDASGNLWLFGGNGFDSAGTNAVNGGGDLNDLWKYNITSNQWTWESGSNLISEIGNYGTEGAVASTNVPGARDTAASWTDTSGGKLWLFGGNGFDSTGTTGLMNDLWNYDIAAGEWTWVNGSNVVSQDGIYGTQGTPAMANVPGARQDSVTWTDASGNLWLFGGFGLDMNGTNLATIGGGALNDLWKFSSGQWTWVSGSFVANQNGTYGTQGTPGLGNSPGARFSAVGWMDKQGNLWLFGGFGLDSNGAQGELSDLWKFTVSSGEWTYVSGPSVGNMNGVYGTQGTPAAANNPGGRSDLFSWTDPSGNFWLFGGFGLDSAGTSGGGELNDLWMYNTTSGEWTWVNGPKLADQDPLGVYGTQGTPAPGNIPGSREGGASWTDTLGNLLLFGGSGVNSVNDLWMYFP